MTDEYEEMLRQMFDELVAAGEFEVRINEKGERVYRMTDLGRARVSSGRRSLAVTPDKRASR
jgi:hypothetical protein